MYNRKRKYGQSSKHNDDYDNKRHHKHRIKEQSKRIDECKFELRRFLEEECEIRNQDDFWTFCTKYTLINLRRSQQETFPFDRNKLFNISFDLTTTELLDKLPVLDKNGDRLIIKNEDFDLFLKSIKAYQDFQQKNKFLKLKKLRESQKQLPIAEYKEEITKKLKGCRVMLIAGDTGCGKSTQIPQYVMNGGYERVVCTQPRRIACVSLAKRVAYETLSDYKNTIGYQIRFEKTKRKDTKVIFMTEGLLLRQASEEDVIGGYDVIILDEVHERHLYGDFLVGIMKCFLYKNKDFKLILMSATINLKLFIEYFSNESLEVIQVPGRLFPIEIHYKPVIKDPYDKNKDKFDCTPYLQIVQMIDEKYPKNEKGDLLIFLNGFSEINTLHDVITEYSSHKDNNWIVLMLHSTLSLEQQDRVFDYPQDGVRKCIISTNIAETSVTIDGIRFVIDSGKVNRMSYVSEGGINRLAECDISQDSARQRMGRAGRTGPGICFRFYSEEDYKNFEPFTPAEIHLVPLNSLLLHMISLGLNNIYNFPFLEQPSQDTIEESIEKLKFCGALSLENDSLTLTSLGEKLSKLPVDLCIGKMLIISTIFGNVNSILACAALLSVQSPYTQTAFRDYDAQELRKRFESNHGDPITLLFIYKEWLTIKQNTSIHSNKEKNSKFWARKRCLEEQRFYETTKLLEQFREILIEADLLQKLNDEELTSRERSIRYGELKKLKSLRNDLKLKSKSSAKKRLSKNLFDNENEDNSPDLRDIEFKITNDFKRLQKLLDETSPDSYKDVILLKLVISSGLYPQIAVEDEHNNLKTVNERLFHTKNKSYLFLRPTSIFASHPDILELNNDDIDIPPSGYFSRNPLSKKHNLLVYQSVLKTKKTYLVNVMRMPALQTLLLLSKNIATNATLTSFIFDEFLSVHVPYVGEGKASLKHALNIRKKWDDKLEKKLNDVNTKSNEDNSLINEIIKFMSSEISYNIKRLLPADLKTIYNHNTGFFNEDYLKNTKNPFDLEYEMKENALIGGVQVTENVTYNCLNQDEWDSNLENEIYNLDFNCPNCGEIFTGMSFFRIFQHESFCVKKIVEEELIKQENVSNKPNSKLFKCDVCKSELVLTPIEILKHKKNCVVMKKE
ncbi:probable ATP-dependent RNA helicase DHX34 [Onthophagus taurus]|uniref:probable ATP-dependent RNA helicase DHX34 n=1 Tax=Onthophagus taurus TaxID=166361 RepID=UPI0039BE7116